MKFRIVLLPRADHAQALTDYSETFGIIAEGYRLDLHHAPHLTVVAFEVDSHAEANVVWKKLKLALIQTVHCQVKNVTIEDNGFVFVNLLASDTLQAMQNTVRAELAEDISREDFDMYAARPLHITVAVEKGRSLQASEFIVPEVSFDQLALAQSGKFGSIEGPLSHIHLA